MQNDYTGQHSRMGKAISFFCAGFGSFLALLLILEQLGVPVFVLTSVLFGFVILTYVATGLMARTMSTTTFYVADRRITAPYNGLAMGVGWASASAFLGLAGDPFQMMGNASALLLGGLGGFLLMAVLIAPYLRKSGAYTLPDFLFLRFESQWVRFVAALLVLVVSFLFLVVQLQIAVLLGERFLGLPAPWSLGIVIVTVLSCTTLGGMRGVTRTQILQAIVLTAGLVLPVALMSAAFFGFPLPQLAYAEFLNTEALPSAPGTIEAMLDPTPALIGATLQGLDLNRNFIAIVACLAAGTAAFPFVLMRTLTSATVSDSRRSAGWAMLFIALLLTCLPAYAFFAGQGLQDQLVGSTLTALPDWISHPVLTNGIQICGTATTNLEQIRAACRAAGVSTITLDDISLAKDALLLTSLMAMEIPFIAIALLGVGLLSITLATTNGLLFSMANALSHDVAYGLVDRTAPSGRRLTLSRLSLLAVLGAAVAAALYIPQMILDLVTWTFSLTAASLLPVLLLSIWWKRCTALGASLGMLSGFAVTLGYMLYVSEPPFGLGEPLLWGLTDKAAGVFGMPAGLLVCVLVSLLKRTQPDERTRELLRNLHKRDGRPLYHSPRPGQL
ncbi:VC_2705 family sodium/solute symporter [Coralliovum pocilloporae]|uniref:VC_2705 family sodium/solute symporter n=1 Tax=Coralliovum pocilloporae TaxID=3066369 RepID=UPI0033078EE1